MTALPTGANICPICHLWLHPGVRPAPGVGRIYCAAPFFTDVPASQQLLPDATSTPVHVPREGHLA